MIHDPEIRVEYQSLTRPRRRPRRQSTNFRSFYWLVRMEAAFHIVYHSFSNTTFLSFRTHLIHRGPRAWARLIRRANYIRSKREVILR